MASAAREVHEMPQLRLPHGPVSVYRKRKNSKVWWIGWKDRRGQAHEMKIGVKARALAIREAQRLLERLKALPKWRFAPASEASKPQAGPIRTDDRNSKLT
jgi:hypothetical protein